MKFLKYFENITYNIKKGELLSVREKSLKLSDTYAKSNFEEVKEILERDCMPFLQEIKNSNLLFRGCRPGDDMIIGDVMYKKIPRHDRTPLSTDRQIQEMFDDEFEKHHGTRLRSEGVFTTKSYSQASEYGRTTFMIFPIGDFEYYWFDGIRDFFHDLQKWDSAAYYVTGDEKILIDNYGDPDLSGEEREEWLSDSADDFKSQLENSIEDLVSEVIEGNIEKVIDEEVIFLCDKYYIVDTSMVRFMWDWLDISVPGINENTKYKYLK